jgi:hypothetical protein
VEKPARPSRPAPPPVTAAPAPPPPERRGGQIFGGIGVLAGREGLGPDLAPLAGIGICFGRFQAAATIAGPFSRRLERAPTGMEAAAASDVSQSLLMLGLRYELAGWRLRPFGSVATGLHYVSVRGVPASGYGTPSTSSLSPLVAAGVGVSIQLGKWLFATAEGAALFSDPTVDITIHGSLVGRAGAPSLLAQAGIGIAPQ